jgi:hypothetical protein
MHFDEFADYRFQFPDASKRTASNPFIDKFSEPALDQIQP